MRVRRRVRGPFRPDTPRDRAGATTRSVGATGLTAAAEGGVGAAYVGASVPVPDIPPSGAGTAQVL